MNQKKIKRNLFWFSSIFIHFGFFAIVDAANILAIFPVASQSNFQINEAIMQSLHHAGHNVTFIGPFPDRDSMKHFRTVNSRRNEVKLSPKISITDFDDLSMWQFIKSITERGEKLCENVLQLHEIQQLLHSRTGEYNAIFIQMAGLYDCYLPLAEKLDVPIFGTITTRSFRAAERSIANPYNPAVIPIEFGPYSDQMTLFQRVKNTWYFLCYEFEHRFWWRPKLNEFYKKYYTPDLLHKKKMSLIFVNNHASIFPRALVPNLIDIGGIHIKSAAPLAQDLQDFMDNAKHGVILLTFGSLIQEDTIPSDVLAAFKRAFARIPQNVIWKFDGEVEDISSNVLVTKWIPQRDILAHDNTKAFITHGGISSVYEAIYEAVPMVLIPSFSDQKSNAAFLEKLGVGIYQDFSAMTPESFMDTLNTIVNDTRYYDNVKRLSRTFKDRPLTPQQSVVYWTEYVIRHKGAMHLRTAGADLLLYQYLLLDVALFVFLISATAIFLLIYTIKMVHYFFLKCLTSLRPLAVNKKKKGK